MNLTRPLAATTIFWTAAGSEAPRRFWKQPAVRKAVSPLRSATAVQIFVVRARSCRIVLRMSEGRALRNPNFNHKTHKRHERPGRPVPRVAQAPRLSLSAPPPKASSNSMLSVWCPGFSRFPRWHKHPACLHSELSAAFGGPSSTRPKLKTTNGMDGREIN